MSLLPSGIVSAAVSNAASAAAFAAQAYAAALGAMASDPADRIRVLASLIGTSPDTGRAGADQTARLMRRAALGAIATACAAASLDSYEAALALIRQVIGLFEAEIVIAADAGDDASYRALSRLKGAVIEDLMIRAAALPHLVTVSTREPQDALSLAYQLYGDATRADDLIARADPVHPAFMPLSFQALAR